MASTVDLGWLEDFLALAESGNFSRAAEQRHVTQPAFSRRVRALEDWAGTALFERSGQPVTLTAAGRGLRPVAAEVVQRLRRAREEAREAGLRGVGLRFAATHALSFGFFPGWLRSLESAGPLLATQLVSDSLQACERLMLGGHAQFLLCHHHPAAPSRLEAGGFRSIAVGQDALCLVGAPGLVAAPGAAAARGLAAAPGASGGAGSDGGVASRELAYSPESGLGRIVAALRPAAGGAAVFTSPLAAVLRGMARDGRGLAWLPLSLIAADLEDGTLLRAEAEDIAVQIRLFRGEAGQAATAEAFWSRLAQAG